MNVQLSAVALGSRLGIETDAGLLRVALKLDALVTGANGLAYLALADVLDGLLGVPAGTLRGLGAFLVAFAALVWLTGTRRQIRPAAAEAVISANAAWVVASVSLVAFDWLTPSTAGVVWALMQAATVAGFAALQYAGLRRLGS
jgi:hypothetical protein